MKDKIITYRYYFLTILMLVSFSSSQGKDKGYKKNSGIVPVVFDSDKAVDDEENPDLISFEIDPDPEILAAMLSEKLDSTGLDPYFPNNRERRNLEEKLKSFYEEKDLSIVWTTSKGVSSQGKELLTFINKISDEGLNPIHYNLEKFDTLLNKIDVGSVKDQSEVLVDLDLLFTSTYLVLASDLSSGRLNPKKFENDWYPTVPENDLKDILLSAIEKNNIKASLQDLTQDHPQYQKLKKVLAHYVKLDTDYQWDKIEFDSVIQKGDSGKIISELRKRIEVLGDLSRESEKENEANFDDQMEEAIKSFQKRHGLKADGILGPNTYSKLNIPLKNKINQIKLNLERIRWLPPNLGDTYFIVNVPEFMLRIYEHDKIVDEMKVIVGKEYNSTPIFSDTLEYLTFSPDWTLPLSILRENLFDDIVNDPGYLERNHYVVYLDWDQNSEPVDPYSINWEELDREEINFRVVQKPGPWNPLGRVKFMMPNNLAIYLHDTPKEHLFDRKNRGFSHGCIRVERPLELAEFLLKDDPSWNRKKFYDFLNLDEPENVILPKEVPVHIVYKTTWVGDDDKVYFLPDIYNHDEIQISSLEKTLYGD